MNDTATSIENMDRELQSFQKLLQETLENQVVLETQLTDQQITNRTLREENYILAEENTRLTAIVHQRLGYISNFVQEFQKNIQDVLNYQRNKQEILNTLKELMEKNVRYEKEIKRLTKDLEEKKDQLELMQNLVTRFETTYIGKLDGLTKNVEDFFQQSITTYNKNVIYEQNKKLQQKEAEISAMSLEHGKVVSSLNNKINQKQMELDLLRIDYQQLMQDSINKQPKIKEIEVSTDRKRREPVQTIVNKKSTSSSDYTSEKPNDRKNNRRGGNKRPKASYFEDSMIKHFK